MKTIRRNVEVGGGYVLAFAKKAEPVCNQNNQGGEDNQTHKADETNAPCQADCAYRP